MSAHRILHGSDFFDGAGYQREARHRRVITSKCAPVLVTPADLAACIGWDGELRSWDCEALIKKLIDRAHTQAVGQTLGILSPVQEPHP